MKVQHKRSGNIAKVVSNNGIKVVVKDIAKGSETELAISTFKRWWKKIDDEPIDDDKAGDGTPLVEVGKEILEQAKEKAGKAAKKSNKAKGKVSKAKKEKSAKAAKEPAKKPKKASVDKAAEKEAQRKVVEGVVALIENTAKKSGFTSEVGYRDEVFYKLPDSKYLFKVVIRNKYCVIYTKTAIVGKLDGANYSTCNFDTNIKVANASDGKDVVTAIVAACADYNSKAKESKKDKKEDK